jgi:hypothetical protein
MKNLIVFISLLAGTFSAFAQKDAEDSRYGKSGEMQTLFNKDNALGGYGAISMRYTQIDDRDAFEFGARGGVVMGHVIALGIAGSGFFNDVHYNSVTGTHISLAGGYGGFFFEPIIMPNFPVHVSFPILIGAGGVGVMTGQNDNWNNNFKSQASDAFMIIEPGMELELNITRFFRFCIGGYYRYTTDVVIEDPVYDVPKGILRGFSGGVTFKFGRF